MDFDAVAQCAAVINDGVGMQDDFVAQFAIVLDNGVCQDAAAFAEYGVRADVGVCADFAAGGNGRTFFDDGGRMDAAARFDDGRKQAGDFGEIEIGVVGDNQVAPFKFVHCFGRNDDRTRAAVVDFGFVFRIGEEADVFRLRVCERAHGGDGNVLAAPFAAKLRCDLGQGVGF